MVRPKTHIALSLSACREAHAVQHASRHGRPRASRRYAASYPWAPVTCTLYRTGMKCHAAARAGGPNVVPEAIDRGSHARGLRAPVAVAEGYRTMQVTTIEKPRPSGNGCNWLGAEGRGQRELKTKADRKVLADSCAARWLRLSKIQAEGASPRTMIGGPRPSGESFHWLGAEGWRQGERELKSETARKMLAASYAASWLRLSKIHAVGANLGTPEGLGVGGSGIPQHQQHGVRYNKLGRVNTN